MINRNALRIALTAGLGNAFASLSKLGDSQYVALAVLSVSSGTYGTSIELGRQRLLGTVLGSLLLLVGYRGLTSLPMPLALAITLGCLRLLGGALGLKVGYKVGGIIVVMGWLVHQGDLASWIPLRFFWTAFGVMISLLSLRLLWPARSLDIGLGMYADLLGQLQSCYRELAARVDPNSAEAAPPMAAMASHRALRNRLQLIRQQRPSQLAELGAWPERHPSQQLLRVLEATASRLITMVVGMVREAPSRRDSQLVQRLHQSEAELLHAMAIQLGRWEHQIRNRRGLPQPPADGLQLPRDWQQIIYELSDPTANTASLERLEHIAARLLLCRQAEQAIRDGEANWSAIVQAT